MQYNKRTRTIEVKTLCQLLEDDTKESARVKPKNSSNWQNLRAMLMQRTLIKPQKRKEKTVDDMSLQEIMSITNARMEIEKASLIINSKNTINGELNEFNIKCSNAANSLVSPFYEV